MAREDRRQKLALDESYRYYRQVEADCTVLSTFRLTKSLNTLNTALSFAEHSEFKLTRQLWKRLQQALFDRLITSFPGCFLVKLQMSTVVPAPARDFPADAILEFHPEGCKRQDDVISIEISRIYPKTYQKLLTLWQAGQTKCQPSDFEGADCDGTVCYSKPIVLGLDVLNEESTSGKNEAYQRWWELYWQAYCTGSRRERSVIYKHMTDIEAVWGNLYY